MFAQQVSGPEGQALILARSRYDHCSVATNKPCHAMLEPQMHAGTLTLIHSLQQLFVHGKCQQEDRRCNRAFTSQDTTLMVLSRYAYYPGCAQSGHVCLMGKQKHEYCLRTARSMGVLFPYLHG